MKVYGWVDVWVHIFLTSALVGSEWSASRFCRFFFTGSTAPSGPGPCFHFHDHFTDGRTPWTSDQLVARAVPKHRTTQTQNKHIHTPNIHTLCGIRNHDPGFRAKTVHALDRSATVTGPLPLYPGERAPSTHWIGGWVGLTAGLDDVEKRKFVTLPGIELRPLGRPARSQSLYGLRYPGSTLWFRYFLRTQESLLSCLDFTKDFLGPASGCIETSV
jgi:hypothetical protein